MSRVLPVVPNLEHLRKQAKSLLRDLRLKRQDAKLSEAQHEIATQYGFKNWPALKAQVESAQPSVAAPSIVSKRGKEGVRIHIAPDNSAAGSLKQAMRRHGVGRDGDVLLTNPDNLSVGQIPPFVSLKDWCKKRTCHGFPETSTRWIANESLWGRTELLREANSIVLWIGTGAAEQLLLVWTVQLLQRLDIDPGILQVNQLVKKGRIDCKLVRWMSPQNLAEHPEPAALSRETIAELNLAWCAIAAPEPEPLVDFVGRPAGHAPFLRPALRALIERYPDRNSGLSRADMTLLKMLKLRPTGNRSIGVIGETLGAGSELLDIWDDSWLWQRLRRLADVPQPALTLTIEASKTYDRRLRRLLAEAPSEPETAGDLGVLAGTDLEENRRQLAAKTESLNEIDPDDTAFARFLLQSDMDRRTLFKLTDLGSSVVQGKASFLEANGIDDWVLGVHLSSRRGRVWYRGAGKPLLTRAL